MTSPWPQVSIEFPNWDTAESIAVTHVGPALEEAESTGLIATWFYIRKAPCWRLRFRAHTGRDAAAARTLLHNRLAELRHANLITRWVDTIYEPEIYAFGGPTGMRTAHHLFHHDSRHILAYLRSDHAATGAGDQRRELSILFIGLLLRGAGQDWYEQGDVWARIARHRSLPPDTSPEVLHAARNAVQRLITVDTTQLLRTDRAFSYVQDWAAGYTQAGIELADHTNSGALARGIRAVLTHHVLFAWNRIGLTHDTQALLAHSAKSVMLDQ